MSSPPPAATRRRLPRWLALLAACAAPLLAQAQCLTGNNTDDNYILGEAQGANDAQSAASAMHWPTGLVWKRCLEGETFSGGACSSENGWTTQNSWYGWANTYLPQPFTNQANWGVNAGYSQNRLTSGDWRMAYKNELTAITENCGDNPKVNSTVFPSMGPSLVWSGSPHAGDSDRAWDVDFYDGVVYNLASFGALHVLLVRAGQSFAALTSPAAQAGAAGAAVTFPAFTLAASTGTGQAWGGARITGAGSPAFQVNNSGDWVQQAIVKSGDQITVRLTAPSTAGASAAATFTLRSGQTTGTNATGSNGGSEATTMVETTATFTANAPLYTKIANNGAALADSAALGTGASDWACTRDNASGQIWEVKTESGLRRQDHTYSWYDSNPATNGGASGTANGGNCATQGRCDTEKFAQDVNAAGLCGATDWRMPTKNELLGIVDVAKGNPTIDTGFFPNTPASSFAWSGSPDGTGYVWLVGFGDGNPLSLDRSTTSPVRLVRAGQSLAPVLTGLAVQSVTHTSASVQATSSLDGTGYWLVLPQNSPAPTPAQVKAHASAQSVAMSAAAQASGTLTGLSAGTAYDLYFTAYDPVSDQLSAPVQKVQFTTLAAPVAGACATVAASATAPSTGLCSAGNATAVTGSSGQWAWSCNGSGGGGNAACTAPYASQTLSISASPTAITVGGNSTISASSTAGLAVTLAPSGTCTLSGTTATGTAQGTCTITASQAGTGDSGSARYLAAASVPTHITVNPAQVNGACGTASGGTFTSAPSTNLCSAGDATSVTGTGPWNWSCTGLHGGNNSATCTASLQSWPVTASASPTQGGMVTCSPASVAHDGSATCTAAANTGYQFTGWTGACAGQTGTTCTLANVTAAQDSTAQFTQSQYAVTASASPTQGGTATCSPASVAHGGNATCTATASTGYQFTGWTGACAGQTGTTCTLANVTAAQDSVAQFTQNTLPVPEGPQAGQPLAAVVQPANSWQLAQASTQTVASLNAPALPAGVTLPQGVVRLRLALGTQGSEATVVLTYPQALPAGTVYYKFGKTQDNQQPHWYPFPGAQVSGNTITLTLKDGGAGDDDLQQNSVIDDPGGPALLAAPSSPASIPTLGEWALALLAAALGLFSLGALRRRG